MREKTSPSTWVGQPDRDAGFNDSSGGFIHRLLGELRAAGAGGRRPQSVLKMTGIPRKRACSCGSSERACCLFNFHATQSGGCDDLRMDPVGRVNLDHATRRLTSAEIEQAIWNADRMSPNRGHQDRAPFTSMTDGGKRVVVIVEIVGDGVRPITGWEA